MSWSQSQRAILEAMGYTLYVRPGDGLAEAAPAGGVQLGDTPASRAHSPATAAPPAGLRPATGPSRPGGFERLEAALRRAARGRELAHVLPPLAELRASPAAKRAFWPVLRALRRLH
ncbi:hypothetical protein [Arenimonas fontis]|uniref:hypothetical protein n=1 Tax=Arenimonas fontis TaxID=2608255 RepID=UPI001661CF6A|nr:hypothetical protein [Arenimonas fontis]